MPTEKSIAITICLTAKTIRELQAEFDRVCIAQGMFTFIPQKLVDLAAIVLDAIDSEKNKEKCA